MPVATMDEGVYRIREFIRLDYPAEAELLARLEPSHAPTPDELQRRDETFFRPPLEQFKLVAEVRSPPRTVGIGSLRNDPESFDPRIYWVHVSVDRDHQGHGVGLELAHRLTREARRRAASHLWTDIRSDDPRAKRFFERQGFVERRRTWDSRLDIAAAIPVPDRTDPLKREGIRILTLAELDVEDPGLVQEVYELSVAVSADEPRMGSFTPLPLAQFVKAELSGPSFLPEAYFLARAGGRIVAMTALRRKEGDAGTLHQVFTGTLREFRGRGIATELKRRAMEYARSHGYHAITTGNDSLNGPMLAVNRKLGFRAEHERIVGELLL